MSTEYRRGHFEDYDPLERPPKMQFIKEHLQALWEVVFAKEVKKDKKNKKRQ